MGSGWKVLIMNGLLQDCMHVPFRLVQNKKKKNHYFVVSLDISMLTI